MLTIGAVKAAAPQARAYKLHDTGGLFLFVTPAGTKSWRLKYRFKGREKLLVLGRYPDIALQIARARREAAREKLAANVDPGAKKADGDRVDVVARAWHRHGCATWSPAHAEDVLSSLDRDVFPAIGARPISSIEPAELLELVRVVERRGCLESAGRLRQRLSAIFGFAIAEGHHVTTDPAAQLGRAMAGGKLTSPHPALVTVAECRQLLADVAALKPGAAVLGASQLLALTAVRLDAVRGMRWEEIEDLDGDAPLWRVPPARMKLSRAKKGEDRFAHLVPLSPAAVEVLRAAARRRRGSDLVFPGRDRARPIGEATLRDLYVRAGHAGRHVPHGWRASFSTILNEELGESWSAAIDAALAHSPKDKVEAAYNRADRLARRRELMERWAAMLTG